MEVFEIEIILIAILSVVIVLAVVGCIIAYKKGFSSGVEHRKQIAEAQFGSAEEKAKAIVADAEKVADAKKRELLLEAKEENQRLRQELDREIKERRSELSRQENRLNQKEEALDRKTENLERKDQSLNSKLRSLEKKEAEIAEIKQKQTEELERISGMTRDEAKSILVHEIEMSARHDAAVMVKEIEQEAKETAEKKAKNIVAMSIQKVAADHVAETTVSVVNLPSDEMKGRIIGREGRNIRTLETLTGVDLIIDDTPEAVIVSSFDPVRREVAKMALEKLIVDGRIHPARIEESVEKSRKEVEAIIKQEGENAAFTTGVHGLHPELIKLLGKLRYRTSYGQNVLNHSVEVAHLAGVMAGELGCDINLAKRAGLLHDIGKAIDHEIEGSHVTIGADIAKKFRENKDVVHAIMAHHGDVEAQTIVATLVQAADAISAARPGARRENLETYIKRLQKLESIANEYEGVEKSFAIQAGREIRIMVKPEIVNDDGMIIVAKEIAKKIESELEYPGQIKVSLIRETRAVDYAK
ncbi:MAG: ribonuclease Y [Clostridia bacterium]|jgi:ribonuclease Y|nr:ribonuclease Y [Clostridia bacterium]